MNMKKIILLISIILFFYALINIIKWHQDNNHTKEIISEINSGINPSNENRLLDINYFIKMNSDTIGYLIVKNTYIRYPFVHTKNNTYYLNHSIDKAFSGSGWLFMDYRNKKDLNNQNTIIYAHARKDKSMFGTLKNTIKKEWYTSLDNHIVTIITNSNIIHYQVFSTYTTLNESFYIKTKFDSSLEFYNFLKTIQKRSVYNYNVKLNKNDRILTLSSCYTNNKRIVLHAKRLD